MKKLPLRKVPGPKSEEYIKLADECEPLCSKDQTPIVWSLGQGVRV